VNFSLTFCSHVGTGAQCPMTRFQNHKALVFSGIGNPQAFLEDLKASDIEVVEEIRFQDHFQFSADEMKNIRKLMREKHIAIALTTEKDAVKIKEWVRPDDAIWAVALEVELVQGTEAITKLLESLSWGKSVENGVH